MGTPTPTLETVISAIQAEMDAIAPDIGEVRAYEQVTLHGLVVVSRRLVSYGPINPKESHRIIVEQALVEGRMKEPFSFLHIIGK